MDYLNQLIGALLIIAGAFNLYMGFRHGMTPEIHCIVGAMCLIIANIIVWR